MLVPHDVVPLAPYGDCVIGPLVMDVAKSLVAEACHGAERFSVAGAVRL